MATDAAGRDGFIVRSRPPLAVYDGSGRVGDLLEYRRVVLRPQAYCEEELAGLRQGGTEPLAALSLSEDPGPPAPWQCSRRNRESGAALVHVDHPGWSDHLRAETERILAAGFCGLFLDTLNAEWTSGRDLLYLLELVRTLREAAGTSYLLANGGFAMLPRLAEYVDGVVFESFSARHVDGAYAAWPTDVLAAHGRLAERLLGFDMNLYALDYADDEELAAFARQRAQRYGMSCFVSDKSRSTLPWTQPVEAAG